MVRIFATIGFHWWKLFHFETTMACRIGGLPGLTNLFISAVLLAPLLLQNSSLFHTLMAYSILDVIASVYS